MPTATLTSKGQTTVPKEVREFLHLQSGDALEFIIQEGGVMIRPATLDVKALKGFLKRPGQKPVSVEQMKTAVQKRFGTAA